MPPVLNRARKATISFLKRKGDSLPAETDERVTLHSVLYRRDIPPQCRDSSLQNKPPLRVSTFRGGLLPACAPRWGSNYPGCHPSGQSYHFNPRSPHWERLPPWIALGAQQLFQSTLPRWGSDDGLVGAVAGTLAFQSMLPRMGSDGQHQSRLHRVYDFNPRSPWGSDGFPHLS